MTLSVAPWRFPGFATLGEAWRALEDRVPASFFQSWTWVGCLAEERFPDPVVLRADREGRIVGLALFNRRARLLHLGESGEAERDRPFTEHNGPLAEDAATAAALLHAAWRLPGAGGLVLSGVRPELAAGAGGTVLRQVLRQAPRLDLDRLRAAGGDLSARLSANARYQIRRSDRHYAGPGDIAVARAETPADIDAWFGEFVELHEATWQRRGRPGAFATDFLRRFHLALMRQALARGELDLLRVTGVRGTVGLLYNFRHRGVAYAYQSALTDPAGEPHARPGLTCHARAIALSLARGDHAYDFLAGDQRYKRSFADIAVPLAWVELVPRWSVRGMAYRLGAATGRLLGRRRGQAD